MYFSTVSKFTAVNCFNFLLNFWSVSLEYLSYGFVQYVKHKQKKWSFPLIIIIKPSISEHYIFSKTLIHPLHRISSFTSLVWFLVALVPSSRRHNVRSYIQHWNQKQIYAIFGCLCSASLWLRLQQCERVYIRKHKCAHPHTHTVRCSFPLECKEFTG